MMLSRPPPSGSKVRGLVLSGRAGEQETRRWVTRLRIVQLRLSPLIFLRFSPIVFMQRLFL